MHTKITENIKNIDGFVDDNESTILGDWHANLIVIDRCKCLFIINDTTLYSLFIPNLNALGDFLSQFGDDQEDDAIRDFTICDLSLLYNLYNSLLLRIAVIQ